MGDDDLVGRLARLEAHQAITQLPAQYAVAVDSRDIVALVSLFARDVDCGRAGRGRDVLAAHFRSVLSTSFYRSQHFLNGHVVTFASENRATGTVYCQAFHEDGDGWYVMAICYFDDYVREDGTWVFERRRERHWHAVDSGERPNDAREMTRWPRIADGRHPAQLPQHWPSWDAFWSGVEAKEIAVLTKAPVRASAVQPVGE